MIGQWEPVVTPEQWRAMDAIFTARARRTVGHDGTPGDVLPGDHFTHHYLLTGVLRCGRPLPDGSLCGTRLRVKRQGDCKQHIYACPGRQQGGCGGLSRRGDKVDEYVTEAVLAKLEERRSIARDPGPWPGEAELARQKAKLETLRAQWQADQISDGFFFTTVRAIEERIRELSNERNRHELAMRRAAVDVRDVRRRWYEDEIDLSQKRAYVREALHAVIVHPAGQGNGRLNTFNPNLLEPVWRD